MTTTVHDPPASLADATTAEWMTFPAARRLLGVGSRAFGHLVRDGLLTVRDVPGSHPKALRRSVEELARQCTRIGELPPTTT